MSRDLLAIAVPARARRSVTLLHALCNHMPKPLMVCGVCLVAAHCFNDRRFVKFGRDLGLRNADGEARYGDDATMRRCDDATMRRYDPFLVKS